MTQTTQILNHLLDGKPITQLEALNLYKCMRLGARIYDLKQRGYAINSRKKTQNGKTFAEYSMGDL